MKWARLERYFLSNFLEEQVADISRNWTNKILNLGSDAYLENLSPLPHLERNERPDTKKEAIRASTGSKLIKMVDEVVEAFSNSRTSRASMVYIKRIPTDFPMIR